MPYVSGTSEPRATSLFIQGKNGALNSGKDPQPVGQMPVSWHILHPGEVDVIAWRPSTMKA